MIEALEETGVVRRDAALLDAVRGGDIAAYGVLYERHLGVARRVAASWGATSAERDDLIAEAFIRVLRVLRSGGGPAEDFRPYLLTTIRNTVRSWHRRDAVVSLVAEAPDGQAPDGDDPTDPMNLVGRRLHATVAADAFVSLPERWRMVLWYTEIEGESPAQVASRLGMTPNGVAALAYRAREGLRRAYLDQHVPDIDRRGCRTVAAQLAGWIRHTYPAIKMRRIGTHVDHCPSCRELAARLRVLNQELPAVVAPLILCAPFAVASWTATAGSIVSAGGVLAGATGTGLSWLTAVKTVVAGAALITSAVRAPAAAPVSGPVTVLGVTGGGLAIGAPPASDPGVPTEFESIPGRRGGSHPATSATYVPTTSGGPAPASEVKPAKPKKATSGNQQARPDSKAAAGQDAKQAKKAKKAAKKADRKANKAAKKSAKKKSAKKPA